MNFPLINRDIPAVVRAAQLVGVTGTAMLAGASVMTTIWAIPALMEAPAPIAAKQWKRIYDGGKIVVPPASILSGAIFGFLAWRERGASNSGFGLYTAAAILTPAASIAYTLGIMMPTNDKLTEKATSLSSSTAGEGADEAGVAKEDTVNALLDKWATMNLLRGVLIATSAVLGAWASLQPTEVLGLDKVEFLTNANRMG